jgi:tetratricopeptide (TPR) repeat protein
MRLTRLFPKEVLGLLLCLVPLIGSAGDELAKQKDRARSYLIEARRLAADYKIDKAADKAREALKNDPTLGEAYVYLGMERFRAGAIKAAKDDLSHAIELDPYQAAAHCQLGFVLYQDGDIESATDHWNLSARLDPTSPLAIAGVAIAQFKNGQQDEAVKTFEKVLLYDRRFLNPNFVASDNGPKWSGQLLKDFEALETKATASPSP